MILKTSDKNINHSYCQKRIPVWVLLIVTFLCIGLTLAITLPLTLPSDSKIREKRIYQPPRRFWNETPGFENLGSTCFMNAALQALFSLHHFSNYVLRFPREGEANTWMKILQDLARSFPTAKVAKPEAFVNKMRADMRMNEGGRQEDTGEFLEQFLGRLRDETNSNQVQNEDLQTFVFSWPQLWRSTALQGDNEIALVDLLRQPFRTPDQEFTHASRVFAYQITREGEGYLNDEGHYITPKQMNRVTIPQEINLLDFHNPTGDDEIYDLKAIIFHQGTSLTSGHYFSHVQQNGIWMKKDDSESTSLVGAAPTLSGSRTATASILFYEKRRMKNGLR